MVKIPNKLGGVGNGQMDVTSAGAAGDYSSLVTEKFSLTPLLTSDIDEASRVLVSNQTFSFPQIIDLYNNFHRFWAIHHSTLSSRAYVPFQHGRQSS